EGERERLSSLLARPAHLAAESAAAQAERMRAAGLAAELAEARREIDRQRAERDRWLDERLSQALGSGDSEGSLASFISELGGDRARGAMPARAVRARSRQARAGGATPGRDARSRRGPRTRIRARRRARRARAWADGGRAGRLRWASGGGPGRGTAIRSRAAG